jgi:hypothetical protein
MVSRLRWSVRRRRSRTRGIGDPLAPRDVAKVAGKLPGGAARALEAAQAARVDWRELLRRAWAETIPADYSWTRSNRRHVWSGLYLPGDHLRRSGGDRDRR